jgi:hypothetical protein
MSSHRDRAAAILVLVFAQQIEKVARLPWDDVIVTDELVTVRLADLEIALQIHSTVPGESSPTILETTKPPHTQHNWVFRGYSPPASTSRR